MRLPLLPAVSGTTTIVARSSPFFFKNCTDCALPSTGTLKPMSCGRGRGAAAQVGGVQGADVMLRWRCAACCV